MIEYVKCFDTNKVSGNKLLKKCNKIWEKISNFLNIEIDGEPVFGGNN